MSSTRQSDPSSSGTAWPVLGALLLGIVIWIAGFAVVLYSHDLIAAVLSGKVHMDTWRNLASGVFLATGVAIAWVVARTRLGLTAKITLIVPFVLPSIIYAAIYQGRWMCGDEPTYIGEPPKPDEGSCSA